MRPPGILVLGLFWCLLGAPAAAQRPVIALILDDMGYQLLRGREALALPGAVTYALLPKTPHTTALAREARARGKELMVHLPMASLRGNRLDAGGLTLGMSEAEFRRILAEDLRAVPGARGVNNHMGSLLTQHPGAMAWLMEGLEAAGDLYFVDSRTDDRTVAERTAEARGLPASRRDVFLDNRREPDYIQAQFRRLVARARRQGSAIGIGHPHPETLAVLRRELQRLDDYGVELLPVSRLIQRQRRSPWPESSFPSPLASKSSRR